MLRRLSAFLGGWTLEAAEGVCAGEGIEDWEVLDLLSALVDKSLVVYEAPSAAARYRLLETVRQYARDRLAETRETEVVRGRHRDYFLRLAQEARPHLFGAEQGSWLERLEREHDNVRVALEWCRSDEEGAEAGLRLAESLYRFWRIRGYAREGREWLQTLLERTQGREPSATRAWALNRLATLALCLGESDTVVRPWLEEGLAIARQLGAKVACAHLLHGLGNITTLREGDEAARAYYEEAVALSEEAGDKAASTLPLMGLAKIAARQGDQVAERHFLEQCLAAGEASGDKGPLARALHALGRLSLREGDETSARSCFERRLALCREIGDKEGIAAGLAALANLAARQGDFTLSHSLVQESLAVGREEDDPSSSIAIEALVLAGQIARRQHDPSLARSFFEQALGCTKSEGTTRPAVLWRLGRLTREERDYASARSYLEQSLALCRAAHWDHGTYCTVMELAMVDLAQGDFAAAKQHLKESLTWFDSQRNRDAAVYVLEGFAYLAVAQEAYERAVRLLGAAERWRRPLDNKMFLGQEEEQQRVDALLLLCTSLGEDAFSVAWAAGRAMTLERVIEYALNDEQ